MYLGIDLGGTKIEAVVLERQGNHSNILFRKRVTTPQQDYQAILSEIAELVAQAEQQFGLFRTLGIGTPGARSQKTGNMKNCNSTCLNGKPLVTDLEQRLNKTVIQANDANCFALSEAVDGAAKSAAVVFGVILGTGVGGGIVVNQQVLQGANRIAGEWGHNPLPAQVIPQGELRKCYCGKVNCVETYLSGPGFVRSYQTLSGKSTRKTASLSAKQIAAQALSGDAAALRTVDRYATQLAAALSEVINILDPDMIVLGGGMSNLTHLYRLIPRLLPEFVFSDLLLTQVVPPEYGDSSGVRGAAWLTQD